MDKIEVYALDDDGNRIEPQQEVEQKEEEVSQEVLSQEAPEEVKEENELPQQKEEESSEGQEQEQVEEQDQKKLLTEEPEKDDNWFLSRLKDRYEVELNSIDDLKNVLSNTEKEKENLPEDVEKYMEFRKETGRSFSDFAELQKDWATVGDGDILRQYYEQTKPHLDREDIEHILNEQFSYDQEIDDDKDIRAKKIAHKEALYEARNHFEKLKEKYKAPLGSSEADIPDTYKEAFSFYNEYKTQNEKDSIARKEQASYFTEKTNSLFSDEFKGFEFNLGDEKKVFKPSDLDKVKSNQSNVQNFISQHVDEKGLLKDPATYHRSLYTAMNPDAIAKHFYEQGKSDATGDIIKETKNIDMGVRENTVTDTGGTKFRIVESEDKFEFKIKKRN